ncbi:hypothetical protein [Streptomyces malaysiensis]|uniref:hypothetical protein n=1 Tax=Streptomyces malaysiensis TaxID=92644 RepID=UPI000852B6B3|nr:MULTISPECIES: hypothetical protein [Streptomyces]ATL83013.1 hypothetical protein SMALA_2779 [Streptomyces malaysiensis]MCC4321523.1 hypothetical protein [Streptomyces malaysiensis]QDL72788.1 hypothetical protein DNK48_29435 [Streptomyces malaysiensis]
MSSSTATRTVRRRTLRIAAAALIAAAGLSLTACSGSDSTATKPAASAGASSADSSTGAQGSDAKVDTKAGTADKAASPSRTETLVDGSTAEIYKLGDLHYRLKIVNDGAVLATLEAKEGDAGLDGNGMFVVLTAGGEVHSWMGGEQRGPGTFKLAGGWTAKVTKLGDLHYRAEILGNEGSVDGTLEADQHDDGLEANGVHIVLSAGGVISAHE